MKSADPYPFTVGEQAQAQHEQAQAEQERAQAKFGIFRFWTFRAR